MSVSVLARLLAAPAVALAIGVAAGSPAASAAAGGKHVQPNGNVKFFDTACKSGFLLHQGKRVYVAIPASCTALPLDEGKLQNGCRAATAPLGTPAKVTGAKHKAILVYDSFTRMQNLGEKRHNVCDYNDLALLKLDPSDAKGALGGIPGLSAPTSVSRKKPANGSTVTFGRGTAVAGATTHGGWVHELSGPPALQASDVGTPITQNGGLVGMLTAIPVGAVSPSSAATYNVHRAINIAKGMHHFRRLRLVKAD